MHVLAFSLASLASANMMDVIETHKVPPASCKHGCAAWATKNASFWAHGKVPADAGSHCAQPGAPTGVDMHTDGAWCFCNPPTPAPVPVPTPAPGPHPLDKQVLAIYDTDAHMGNYVSIAISAAPPGEPRGSTEQTWLRSLPTSFTAALPLRFEAVPGQKDRYQLFGQWVDSDYNHYIGVDNTNSGYVYMGAAQKDAMVVQLVETASSIPNAKRYVMVNQSPGAAQGRYVSWRGADGTWLRANYTSLADAMIVELRPNAPVPGTDWGYCTSASGVAEQINLQIAAPHAVVVSFVTFEPSTPTQPPIVRVGRTAESLNDTVTGVTHVHVTASKDRTYYMHFVKLDGLEPRARYYYSVQSGGSGDASNTTVSDVFSFRAPYSGTDGGKTVADVWGDMGVFSWNNMENLKRDVDAEEADLVIHLGDLAYNEGDDDERRGDGFMTAFQDVLARVPWMAILGNHEYAAGAKLGRYLDQNFQGWGPIAGANLTAADRAALAEMRVVSTATSALGAFVSTGTHHAAGLHGGEAPSGSSRYFSVDFGLIHFVALDLNVYYGGDPCGDPCKAAQLKWLQADLAAANRNRATVPWVIVMSHYPFYCTGCYAKQMTSKYYASGDAEWHGNANVTAQLFAQRAGAATAQATVDAATSDVERLGALRAAREEVASWNRTVRKSSDDSIKDLVPLLDAGGVDLYLAGHWHYYESLYPAKNGATGSGGEPIQKDFVDPTVTVHVTTGNGGPPRADNFNEGCPGPDCGKINATRYQSANFGYGRVTAFNATHLRYVQINNKDDSVEDSFFITQNKHGPFKGS
jgi:3',5'-cyclic AMP phosphodiesterase CpdA